MVLRSNILLFLLTKLLVWCVDSQGNDNLFILINKPQVFKCGEDPGEVEVHEDDVDILDDNGDKVNYIRAPGTYKIHFKRIALHRPLRNIGGEMSALLKVPLFEAPGALGSIIRFDLPYSVVPEKKLLLEDKCDEESGLIRKRERDTDRTYCRYCRLCDTAAKTEQKLQRRKYLPGLDSGSNQEQRFSSFCHQLNPTTYQMIRTVKVPSKSQLKAEVDREYGDKIGGDLKKRFDKGKGQFHVKLNLLTSPQASRPPPRCGGLFSFIPGSKDNCRSQHAQSCLPNSQLAACYTTVFNYRFTENYADVQQFLNSKGLTDNFARGGSLGGFGPQPTRFGPAPAPAPAPQPLPPPVPAPQPRPAPLPAPQPRPAPVPGPQPRPGRGRFGWRGRGGGQIGGHGVDPKDSARQICLRDFNSRIRGIKNFCRRQWIPGYCCRFCKSFTECTQLT